ncbi:MAG: chemotaxis protein CheW [Spirochaetota bacterium]
MANEEMFELEADGEIQGSTAQKRYVAGLGKIDGQVIIILDVEKLVEEQEAYILKEV